MTRYAVRDAVFPPAGFVALDDGRGTYAPVGLEEREPLLVTVDEARRVLLPDGRAGDDPSPRELVLQARAAVGSRLPERLMRRALGLLPEYADARLELAIVLRRQRRQAEALEAMLEAFTSPLAFGSLRLRDRCFAWLRRAPDAALPDSRDPIWLRRADLTLARAVRWNDDYLVYEEAVDAYHELGLGIRAVRLRMLIGDLMSRETVSFHERYGWSHERHAEELRADVGRAGLTARLPLLAER